jgi:oligopeptide/dipeptide ABC transporter ATP-binding protein
MEAIFLHQGVNHKEAKRRTIELFRQVQLPRPETIFHAYPHQISGGQKQRVMIAMALSCNPAILIADEPTTALDVTIQAQILDLLRDMKNTLNLSLLLITHDLGVIAETADRVAVMYAGRIVEHAPVRAIFNNPQHPYTRGLLASMPGSGHGQRLRAIDGSVPVLGAFPPGCTFHPRCPDCFEPCPVAVPPDYAVGPGHGARCYLHDPQAAGRLLTRSRPGHHAAG